MDNTDRKPDPSAIKAFVFDLDGTLIDSKLDLVHSVNAVRERADMPPLDPDVIAQYVGDGARTLIARALDDPSEEELDDAHRFFIYHYHDHALDNTRPYPGVREALQRLGSNGHALSVLTNKPERISRSILERLDLLPHFGTIYGGNSFETKKPDPEGLLAIMGECGAAPEATLMIGDSPIDIRTARNAGAWACGVTYGFHSHLFDESPPDFHIENLGKLADWAGV